MKEQYKYIDRCDYYLDKMEKENDPKNKSLYASIAQAYALRALLLDE